jgi:hypothetical protein
LAGELIPIRVAITSKAHKFLTKRAERLGRDRDEEASRIFTWACVQLIRLAGPKERVYTQAQVDAQLAAARLSYKYQIERLRERLRERLGEREATDGDRP